jgi:hypothetical protein
MSIVGMTGTSGGSRVRIQPVSRGTPAVQVMTARSTAGQPIASTREEVSPQISPDNDRTFSSPIEVAVVRSGSAASGERIPSS